MDALHSDGCPSSCGGAEAAFGVDAAYRILLLIARSPQSSQTSTEADQIGISEPMRGRGVRADVGPKGERRRRQEPAAASRTSARVNTLETCPSPPSLSLSLPLPPSLPLSRSSSVPPSLSLSLWPPAHAAPPGTPRRPRPAPPGTASAAAAPPARSPRTSPARRTPGPAPAPRPGPGHLTRPGSGPGPVT
jgi:hypothetical protein